MSSSAHGRRFGRWTTGSKGRNGSVLRDGPMARAMRIGGADLVRAAEGRLQLVPDQPTLYAEFAEYLIREIRQAIAEDRPCRMIVPVGPRGQYPVFVARCNAERIPLGHVHLFAMDEYCDWQGRWIDETDPLSFRGFLLREVVGKLDPLLGFSTERLAVPDPLHLDAYQNRIASVGGVDACFGGIGIHGHVAFNEPPLGPFGAWDTQDFLHSNTRIVALAPETLVMNSIRANGGDLEGMPPLAVTVGMADIRAARRIRLFCDGGAWQRTVLRRALFDVPSVQYPVTLLREHPDLQIIADAETCGLPSV